jgi:hypothetical protein
LRRFFWRQAGEAAGELRIDTIALMTLTVTRRGGVADAVARHDGRRIGGGDLEWQVGEAWSGQITIHGVAWDVRQSAIGVLANGA